MVQVTLPGERRMKSFLAAIIATVVIAVGASFVLQGMQIDADTAFATTGVRLPERSGG